MTTAFPNPTWLSAHPDIAALLPTAYVEPMSGAFTKYHLGDGRALHRFAGPDDGDWHDHPFTIEVQVLAGGYAEEVLDPETLAFSTVLRQHGDRFTITAAHVHRIPRLLADECWTVARYGPWERKSGFWRVTEGRAERRAWDE